MTQCISNYLDRHDSYYLCTFRNLFIDFAIDTLVGQDAHNVLRAKIYSGHFAPCQWVFLPLFSVPLVLYYFLCKNKVITNKTSLFGIQRFGNFKVRLIFTVCLTLSHLDNSKFRIYIYISDNCVSHMYWKKSESTQG